MTKKYFTTHPDLYPFLNDEYNRLRRVIKGEAPSDDIARDGRLFLAIQQQLKGEDDAPAMRYRDRIIDYLKRRGGRATRREIQFALEPDHDGKQTSVANEIKREIDAGRFWVSGAGGKKDPLVISLEFDPKIHKKPKR